MEVKTELVGVRLAPSTLRQLDIWRATRGFSRPEALRKLAEIGLNFLNRTTGHSAENISALVEWARKP